MGIEGLDVLHCHVGPQVYDRKPTLTSLIQPLTIQPELSPVPV